MHKKNNESEDFIMFTELNEFAQNVKKELDTMMPECEVMINDVVKNNGVTFKGIVIHRKGSSISPQIYLEEYYEEYQNGKKIDSICTEIIHIYKQNNIETPDINTLQFTEFKNVKDKICFRLVNAQKNQELLCKVPHRKMLDLAVTYYINTDVRENLNGSIMVTDALMKKWEITEQTLYELAIVNSPVYSKGMVLPMDAIIRDILTDKTKEYSFSTYENSRFGISLVEEDIQFYVATNTKKLYGATVMLYKGLLKKMGEYIGDFYIIPSSVHEILFIRKLGMIKPADLSKMVCEVNMTEVTPQDVLSDNVYLYDAESDELRLVTHKTE